VKAYPFIGGPYHGRKARTDQMERERRSRGPSRWNPDAPPVGTLLKGAGPYGGHADEYIDYNRAGGGYGPTMIRVHRSLLP
jgi:hypothetical protein